MTAPTSPEPEPFGLSEDLDQSLTLLGRRWPGMKPWRIPGEPGARRRQWVYVWVATGVGVGETAMALLFLALSAADVVTTASAITALLVGLSVMVLILPLTLLGHTHAARNLFIVVVTAAIALSLYREPTSPHQVGGLAMLIVLVSLTEHWRFTLGTSLPAMAAIGVPLFSTQGELGVPGIANLGTLGVIGALAILGAQASRSALRELNSSLRVNLQLRGRLTESHRDLEARVDERTQALAEQTRAVEEQEAELQRSLRTLESLTEEYNRLSLTDELTGLTNRRGLMEAARALPQTGGWLLIGDIDHFKRVNDTVGHSAGDDVLVTMSWLLSAASPPGATVARMGGEEFALLIPQDLTPKQTRVQIEQILASIRGHDWSAVVANLWPVTLSIGAAPIQGPHAMMSAMRRADDALYQAKHAGRDRARVVDAAAGSLADGAAQGAG